MDEVAHDVSWASEKGTKRLVRLPSADVLNEGLSLSTKGTKGRYYNGDNPHASTRRGPPGWPRAFPT